MREVNKARHAVAIVKILDRFECNLTPDWFQTSGKSTVLSACNGSGSNFACLSPFGPYNDSQSRSEACMGPGGRFCQFSSLDLNSERFIVINMLPATR